MADQKQSAFPDADPLDGSEKIPALQGGNKNTTPAAIKAFARKQAATALSIESGVVTIDCALGDYFTLLLTANVTSVVITNPPAAGFCATKLIRITQDPTTPRTIAGWPAAVKWSGGAFAVSAAVNKVDVVGLATFSGGATWLGRYSKDFA